MWLTGCLGRGAAMGAALAGSRPSGYADSQPREESKFSSSTSNSGMAQGVILSMHNLWLTIPLSDYEGHMWMPSIGQADMLSSQFASLLAEFSPASVAVIGSAGGNGFDRVSPNASPDAIVVAESVVREGGTRRIP